MQCPPLGSRGSDLGCGAGLGGGSWRGSACVWLGDSRGRGAGGKAAPPAEGHSREALGAWAGTTGSGCLPTPTLGGGGRPFLALAASPGLAHGCLAAPWPLGPGSRAGPVEAEARLQGEACSGSTGTRWGPQGARGQKRGAGSPQAASLRCLPPAPQQLAQRFCRKHLKCLPHFQLLCGAWVQTSSWRDPFGCPP